LVLHGLAKRWRQLDQEVDLLDEHLERLAKKTAPDLLALPLRMGSSRSSRRRRRSGSPGRRPSRPGWAWRSTRPATRGRRSSERWWRSC
jgi:hypothetical protein